jgi:mono/diheme cytochrome c family protein
MNRFWLLSIAVLISSVASAGDAKIGAQVLQDAHCNQCHKVMGEGGAASARVDAPDLADAFAVRYTAQALASTLWNHTPTMWDAMNKEVVARPKITASEAEDLFTYLYSLRYFDKAGDAKRGQDAWDRKGCSGCHVTAGGRTAGSAPPLGTWRVEDPMALARQMWNHAGAMKAQLAKLQRPWQSLTGRDLADLHAYARQVQTGGAAKPKTTEFSYRDDYKGAVLYESNCRRCHVGSLAPERRLGNKTFLDIAAGMWNHSPRMANLPIISNEEMNSVVGYVWRLQYMGEPGQVTRGRQTFRTKQCSTCHEDAPNANGQTATRILRGERVFSPFHLIAHAWEQGTLMQQAMKQRGVRWPSLQPADVSDIVAYLNTRP